MANDPKKIDSLPQRQAEFVGMLQANEPMIRKIAGDFCSDEDEKRELIQEIVYHLWESLDGFRHEASNGTWIHAVALNVARMNYRSQRRRVETPEKVELKDHPATTEDEKKVNELMMIEQFREADRQIISLLLQGYGYDEIGTMLSIAPQTLRNRVHRLKQRLSGKLFE